MRPQPLLELLEALISWGYDRMRLCDRVFMPLVFFLFLFISLVVPTISGHAVSVHVAVLQVLVACADAVYEGVVHVPMAHGVSFHAVGVLIVFVNFSRCSCGFWSFRF